MSEKTVLIEIDIFHRENNRVFINGHDITDMVKSLSFSATATEVPTVKVEVSSYRVIARGVAEVRAVFDADGEE